MTVERAAAAEAAVVGTYVRPLRHLPGTALGRARPGGSGWTTGPFHLWWQAHLLHALLDAEARSPAARRRRRIHRLVRTVALRNGGWCNDFHDDIAWLALALQRTPGRLARSGHARLMRHLVRHRDPAGLLSWRCSDRFRNVPANGTAAIVFARAGDPAAAARIVSWIEATLRDPHTGLVFDGIQADGHVERALWTYNQGVTLGALVELGRHDPAGPWRDRARALVAATARHLARDEVLPGAGGGDGGLFAGITARYLALAAVRFDDAAARRLVLASADAVWTTRDPHGPRFGADWTRRPGPDAGDLSVQIGAWLTLEAAARVGPR